MLCVVPRQPVWGWAQGPWMICGAGTRFCLWPGGQASRSFCSKPSFPGTCLVPARTVSEASCLFCLLGRAVPGMRGARDTPQESVRVACVGKPSALPVLCWGSLVMGAASDGSTCQRSADPRTVSVQSGGAGHRRTDIPAPAVYTGRRFPHLILAVFGDMQNI